MTEEEKLKILEGIIKNGASIGQLVIENHGTMN